MSPFRDENAKCPYISVVNSMEACSAGRQVMENAYALKSPANIRNPLGMIRNPLGIARNPIVNY